MFSEDAPKNSDVPSGGAAVDLFMCRSAGGALHEIVQIELQTELPLLSELAIVAC